MTASKRVLIACEVSGTVRDSFRELGYEAYSCDLQEADSPYHIQEDVSDILDEGWDMIIAHPPCTYLTVTANRWLNDERYPNRKQDREDAVAFARMFYDKAELVAIENPVGYLSTAWRRPDQWIQPYEYGHTVSKKTGLWLKGLPKLTPTDVVEPEYVYTSTGKKFSKWYWEVSRLQGQDRRNARSKTFKGIADAMAKQWGALL